MNFTGERFLPECLGEIAAEHYHRYYFAASFVAGKTVLDIASGEGYGTHILARFAAHATGVDISPEAVEFAAKKYPGPNISFLRGDAAAIPLPDSSIDVAVSFETLEHLREQDKMLCEIRRILKKEGLLIISTPNSRTYNRTDNVFHVKELCREEFTDLLGRHFTRHALLGQKVLYGSLLSGTGEDTLLLRRDDDAEHCETSAFLDHARYLIALAGNGPLPHVDASFFDYPLEKSDTALALSRNLDEQRKRNAELEELHAAASARLKQVETAYASLLSSKSWTITAPLRRIRRFFPRAAKTFEQK